MLEELRVLFEAYNFKAQTQEHNLFSIGSRAFYENPFTEVLSYILSGGTQFRYRDAFMENLLTDALSAEDLQSLSASSQVSTQYQTAKGNFIDLILYSTECIAVFENKIFHHAANPFDDYVEDINRRFPKHKKYFILLSYKPQKTPPGWYFISIPANFQRFLDSNKFEYLNKWDYYINDFIDHFCIKKSDMTQEEKTFYQENFHKIINASANLHAYVEQIAEDFITANSIPKHTISSSWNKNTKAVRFYPIESNKSNVVLIFNTDGTFSVNIYYYSSYSLYFNAIHKLAGEDLYKGWDEGSAREICCFEIRLPFKDLEGALEECRLQAEKIRTNYTSAV